MRACVRVHTAQTRRCRTPGMLHVLQPHVQARHQWPARSVAAAPPCSHISYGILVMAAPPCSPQHVVASWWALRLKATTKKMLLLKQLEMQVVEIIWQSKAVLSHGCQASTKHTIPLSPTVQARSVVHAAARTRTCRPPSKTHSPEMSALKTRQQGRRRRLS